MAEMQKRLDRSASLGDYQAVVDATLAEMEADDVIARIWEHDHTVWKPDSDEITNRLGWLHIADAMEASLPRLEALAQDARAAGYTHALLLGMGGSSLAPEVFCKTFGVKSGYLDLAVLDSTHPDAVKAYAEKLDPSKTLFIVATKSGGTVETLSFFKYFYSLLLESIGAAAAGEHFVAITDPGSRLAELAERYNFRATFLNEPNIGGRYSALSFFGLVPAALIGMDVSELLERAQAAACNCGDPQCPDGGDNHGAGSHGQFDINTPVFSDLSIPFWVCPQGVNYSDVRPDRREGHQGFPTVGIGDGFNVRAQSW